MGRSWKSADLSAFIATLAVKLKPEARSILDLGVGDGDLAPLLMDRFRGAALRGIDRDETRLGLIEGRLGFYEGKVDLAFGDFLTVPYGSGYDLVVSVAAMRHMAPDDKHRIFSRVHQALAEDAAFLFGDRIKITSPRLAQAVREVRADEMQVEAGKPQPPADYRAPDSKDRETVADTLYALRKAAFRDVDCLYCYGDRAVFVGFK
jgi:cyclopropane fatty-acyl-phospholipid synthase-like methyltransferase